MKGRHLVMLFAILQLAVAFLTESQTFTHEESMWHYIGRNWFRHGMVPYEGGVDNKSPLIFAVFGLSDALFGINYWFPRILGTAVQSVGLYFTYRIALVLAGNRAALMSVVIYGLTLLWRTTGGKYVSFTETYAVSFLTIAVYCFLNARGICTDKGTHTANISDSKVKQRPFDRRLLLAGIFSGVALCWRLSAIFGIIAIVFYCFLKERRKLLPYSAGLGAALICMLLVAVVARIDLHDIYIHGFADNFGTGSTTDHTLRWQSARFIESFVTTELLLLYPGVLIYFFIPRRNTFLLWWLLFEISGIIATRVYAWPHFKHLLPAFALINGITWTYVIERYRLSFKTSIIVLAIILVPKITEPLHVMKKLITGKINPEPNWCLQPQLRPNERAEKELGTWLRSNTSEQDLILVAGFGARVQLYSGRQSPTVYFNVTQTARAKEKFRHEVSANKPDVIVLPAFDDYEKYVAEDLRNFVYQLALEEYDFKQCYLGYSVFRRKPMVHIK